jgi:hypothetical protein
MILTALQMVTEALGLAGALRMDEPVDPTVAQRALIPFNLMLGFLSSKGWMKRATIYASAPITSPNYIYTIGIGGAIAMQKPLSIVSAFTRDGTSIDRQLDIISPNEMDVFPDKSYLVAPPEKLAYDPGPTQQAAQTALGTLTFYPIPDQPYTLFFRSDEGFTQFAFLTDIASFPDEYQEALVYNLTRRIWNKYHNEKTDPCPQEIKTIAQNGLDAIAELNYEDPAVLMDVPTSGRSKGIYNILSDSYQ